MATKVKHEPCFQPSEAMSHNVVLDEVAVPVFKFLTAHAGNWTRDRHNHPLQAITPTSKDSCRCCMARWGMLSFRARWRMKCAMHVWNRLAKTCEPCGTAWRLSALSKHMRHMVFVIALGEPLWGRVLTLAEKQEKLAWFQGYKPQYKPRGYKRGVRTGRYKDQLKKDEDRHREGEWDSTDEESMRNGCRLRLPLYICERKGYDPQEWY